jgi:hypothetical protein
MHLPRVLLSVRHSTVHQPGRTVLVMSVRAALTKADRPSGSSLLIQLFFRDARRRFVSFPHAQAAAG